MGKVQVDDIIAIVQCHYGGLLNLYIVAIFVIAVVGDNLQL